MPILDEFILNFRAESDEAIKDLRNMTAITRTLDTQVRQIIGDVTDLQSVMSDPMDVSSDIEDIQPQDITIPQAVQELREQRGNNIDDILVEHDDIEIPDRFKKDVSIPIDINPDMRKLAETMENIKQSISVLQTSLSTEDTNIISSSDSVNQEITTILGDMIKQSTQLSQEVNVLNETIASMDNAEQSTDTETTRTDNEVQSFREMVDIKTSELRDTISQYSESFRDLERVTNEMTSQMERVSSSMEQTDNQQRDSTSTDRQTSDNRSEMVDTSDIQRSLQERVSAETDKISQISNQIINNDSTLQEFSQQRTRDTVQTDRPGTQQNTTVDNLVGQTTRKISNVQNDTDNIKSIVRNVHSVTSVVNDYLSTVKEVMDSRHNEDISRANEEVYSNNLMSEATDIFNSTSIPEGTPSESIDNYREDTIKELIGKVSSLDIGNTFSTFEGQRLLKRDVTTLVNSYLSKVNRRART